MEERVAEGFMASRRGGYLDGIGPDVSVMPIAASGAPLNRLWRSLRSRAHLDAGDIFTTIDHRDGAMNRWRRIPPGVISRPRSW